MRFQEDSATHLGPEGPAFTGRQDYEEVEVTAGCMVTTSDLPLERHTRYRKVVPELLNNGLQQLSVWRAVIRQWR